MLFSQKKIWLYLILLSLLTTISHAQRVKTIDDYFNDVEKSAKKLGYGLDGIKEYMNEIYKPDLFMQKTFTEEKPKWYGKGRRAFKFSTSTIPTN